MAGWNQQTWGLGTWGLLGDISVSLTGISLTTSLGDETITASANVTPSTNLLTNSLNSVTEIIAVEFFPTGIAMTNTLGTADAGPDAMAVGIQAQSNLGTVEAYNSTGWGRQFWGSNAWGVEGTWANVDVSGIAMTAALGTSTEISAGATVTLNTLNIAQLTLAVVDPAPDAMITGNFMIGVLGDLGMRGDVALDVTGIAMSANLGSIAVDLNTPVDITGIAMSANLASVGVTIHVDVVPTGIALTMSQTSANALIWNQVDTGTAPVDPPGWQEVAA
tara:strand:- start:141 stop:971 length:831 start_codon:yes stop_codon:yes gene_type:complete